MSYQYRMQYPNINTQVFVPRYGRLNSLKKVNEIFLDLTPLNRGEKLYVPGEEASDLIAGVWLSAVISLYKLGDINFLGEDEKAFSCVCAGMCTDYTSVYDVVHALNVLSVPEKVKFSLTKLNKWTDALLALMEGNPVMVGGTVYSSFKDAELTGIVPMPGPGEDLLGGHFFSLVSFNQEKDMALAYGNRGANVGNKGKFQYRGSYLRNLAICRDFFVLVPRIEHASR